MGLLRAGLTNEAYDREYRTRDLMRRIVDYFRPWLGRLALIATMVTLMALFGAALPILVSQGVEVLTRPSGSTPAAIALLVALVLALGVLNWGVNWVRRVETSKLIGDVILAMRRDAFAAVMHHDLSFFDKYQSGRIVSRITSDTDEFGRVAVLVTELVSQLLLVAILLVYLIRVSWQLTLLLCVLAPVAFFIAGRFQHFARQVTRRGQQAIADVNASIQEAVTGISVAKNFRREQGIYDSFLDVNIRSYAIQVRRGWVLGSLFPTLTFFSGVGTAILLYFGGVNVYTQAITAGAWFLFINSVDRFWFPMLNLSAFWSQFQGALSAAERIFALMDAQPVVLQTGSRPVAYLRGEIEFDHVDFGYAADEPVLTDFSLHIRAGESIALVGHTGAGKSSIAKLVTRYYEFQGGQLCIDGQDIRAFDLESYRRHLGIVSQSPFLFAGTVADNIRYARSQMTDAEVEAIARQIGKGDWMETLPEGLQTDVGERGSRLSMGQRQLVVLARMLALDPAIFILDEATASVDPFTESQIQTALGLILHGRTSIVIAHRLSTVKAADRILVLERGRVIEEGPHDALLARGGHYADLYNTYFRHQSLDFIDSRRQPSAQPSPLNSSNA
ncbi:MAG: ABC transporter ATP-binding protein [Caldilineaceae bacterium]|nr:ABC transporter ATP-binding protein [Caldilineaceae bacterium]